VGADAGSDPTRTTARQLFEEDRLVDWPGPRPPVLFVVLEAEYIEGAESGKELAWELSFCLPIVDMGAYFLVDEAPDCPPKLFVLRAEEMGTGRGYVCQ
jgi:hypothetical protein